MKRLPDDQRRFAHPSNDHYRNFLDSVKPADDHTHRVAHATDPHATSSLPCGWPQDQVDAKKKSWATPKRASVGRYRAPWKRLIGDSVVELAEPVLITAMRSSALVSNSSSAA